MPSFTSGQTLSLTLDADDVVTFDGKGTYQVTPTSGSVSYGNLTGRQYLGPYKQGVSLSIVCQSDGSYTTGNNTDAQANAKVAVDASGNPIGLGYASSVLSLSTPPVVDLCIYGATPSGIMAAIAARRNGLNSVVIIEPTAWFGGMVTGGVSHTDVAETQNKSLVTGLANELYKRLANDYYGISQNSFWTASYNAEPSASAVILKRMLAEKGVYLVFSSPLVSVTKSGTTLVSAAFSRATIAARTWIDASYEGDLVAAAGCDTVIGREANATYSETHNGVATPAAPGAASYQFPASVDPYVVPGVPGSGLLPYMSSNSLAAAGTADPRCQALCLRLTLSKVAGRIPFPAPSNYNAANYELLGRALAAGFTPTGMGDMFTPTTLRGTSKSDLNNKACMSLDYVHPTECTEWVTATWERRAVIAENVKQYTLGLIKFLQTDSRVPAAMKTDLATYGLAPDEYADFGNITPYVYVREGRRLVGDYVATENQMILANGVTDPIAYGYYFFDSHTVQNVVVSGQVRAEGPNQFQPPFGFPVSYKVLLPKASQATNLWATSAMSTTRVQFGVLRMEPVLMAMGQAAGVAASIAVARGVTAANVPYADLAQQIDIKGVLGTRFGGRTLVLDVSGTYTNGTYTETGTWTDSTSLFGFVGTKNRVGTAAGSSVQKFAPNITEPGQYGVYVRHSVATTVDGSRTSDASLLISGADGTKTLVFNQQSSVLSGDWDYFGDAYFNTGTPSANFVQITAGATSNTVTSAVAFVKRNP